LIPHRTAGAVEKTRKEILMTTSIDNKPGRGTHPVMIAAGAALILFCGVGTAAVMGWLPTSIGGNPSTTVPEVPVQATTTHAQPHTVSHTAPHAVQHHVAAAPVKLVCSSCGVVESTRVITTRAEGSGVGAAGGAVLGGLLGHQVGGGHGKELMTVAGAIGGAVAGNQIEGRVNAAHSYEITVRMDDGSTRTVQQSAASDWRSGDHVKIVDGMLRSNG
jgi:outer membrane lipoprotein SlyB